MYIFFLKKFEKVEKTGIISTKFLLRCTPSVILGIQPSNLSSALGIPKEEEFKVGSSFRDCSTEPDSK